MTVRIYGYLRASTTEQNADRAKPALECFALNQGVQVSAWFTENESGASMKRPELFRLLDVAQPGDVLLLEQIDRLSRLNGKDWHKLRGLIQGKGLKIVSMDLPISHTLMDTEASESFQGRILDAINGMLLDMLAAVSRKDYEDRRRRQSEGIARAKELGRFKGRPVDTDQRLKIVELRKKGFSYSEIERMLGCSRSTVASAVKCLKSSCAEAVL
ncbi:recombinase family protein [Desulfobotulus mexicanus]|uniref:Helix-turn-helix domain-containing protein n=1 Tax=Desulfobotulus mexicanus TaxID=2586642 RepID=A0A5S5MCM3_9BACT|nr:recombinase family protein [Desulfobotulus mexicanus]TYT73478.1 helix-turn-helix domain-containing protein [Desulfobotulus mexicanus]